MFHINNCCKDRNSWEKTVYLLFDFICYFCNFLNVILTISTRMNKRLFFSCALIAGSVSATMACTNFLVGKNATVDGSTLISYAADSYSLYGALYHYPAADYPAGALRDIYEWDTGKYLGQIPEVIHTYSVIGNMNEHQLTIGETTYGGRTELVDTTGLLDYGSLIYITLQRCRTAREAIRCMTDLAAQYGYCSEGESFSIGDPDEVWILEMIGKGAGNKGTVWAAARIPDDCVSAHANQARITTIDFKDKENWMWAEDVVDFAREEGYFKGKDKDFSFSDTYAPLDFSGLYVCEARVWSFFRRLNPETDRYLSYVMGESKERMPLWIQPVQKVSVQDFQHLMRDQYQETPLDITQGTAAGPWHSKLRYGSLTFKLDSTVYWYPRPTATQQTGFSFVAQMRGYAPDHIGGIFWFGVDDAATNLYVPMYCRVSAIPWCYDLHNGSLLEYSSTSAFWTFNAVANFAYGKYSLMLPEIQKVQSTWENYFKVLVSAVDMACTEMNPDDARVFLTRFSCSQAEESTAAWKKLGEYLLVKYLDGQQKKEKDGRFMQNEFHIPPGVLRPAYPEEFLRKIASEVEKDRAIVP